MNPREIITSIKEAEAKAEEKLAVARQEAEKIIVKAHQQAKEIRERARKDAMLETEKLINAATEEGAKGARDIESDNKAAASGIRESGAVGIEKTAQFIAAKVVN